MAEPGWPLIPREVLPASPRPRPARTGRPRRPPTDAGRQLSIFGADTTEPSPADLAGLLAGPGRLGRMGGTARVSVRVDAAWRVHVLVAELVGRGLVVQWLPLPDPAPASPVPDLSVPASSVPEEEGVRRDGAPPESGAPPRSAGTGSATEPVGSDDEPADADDEPAGVDDPEPADYPEPADDPQPAGDDGHGRAASGDAGPRRPGPGVAVFEVRTAYSSRLNGLARAWPAAADQLFLSGPRLRLWVAAAGAPRDHDYALGLDPDKSVVPVDSALRRAGLQGTLSEDGLHYLISGRKRLARLAELVGDRPEAAPADLWPDGASA